MKYITNKINYKNYAAEVQGYPWQQSNHTEVTILEMLTLG